MNDAELQITVLQALDGARPDGALEVLGPLLSDHLGARQVRLLLANYHLTALRPIQDPDDRVVLRDTPGGEAFVTQRAVVRVADQDATVYLPVSLRGDRIGVLQLTLPNTVSPSALEQLGQLATVIAYALQAADRQSDAVQRAARSERLTLAAELQWQLLPGRGCRAPEYQLAGHLEPAQHVHADNFDWSQDDNQLLLSVTDGGAQSRGRVASLLSTLAVTALRNARRAGLKVADQVRLTDQAVYAHYQGHQYVSTLLVGIDLRTGRVSAVRAGSPRLFILRGGRVLLPSLTDQLPVGMFDGTDYVEEHLALAHQDRLLLVSDGIHAATSPTRVRFGDDRLPKLLIATADLPVGGVVRRVIDELFEHRDLAELDDDAAVVCLDWLGPGRADPVNALPQFHATPAGGASNMTCGLSLVPDGQGGERTRAPPRARPPIAPSLATRPDISRSLNRVRGNALDKPSTSVCISILRRRTRRVHGPKKFCSGQARYRATPHTLRSFSNSGPLTLFAVSAAPYRQMA
ncbi:MAG: PP2C family protein-serine/threonine phosphatase [Nakamurella sp.]